MSSTKRMNRDLGRKFKINILPLDRGAFPVCVLQCSD